jgi:Protein of unknown function (DUF445)
VRHIQWKTFALIPVVAALVGWFTNWLAVQMIFRPLDWWGIPLIRREGQPLGFIGWQGIVPAKTMTMSEAMVNATITQLLSMEEMIQRVDPGRVAQILLPQANSILEPVVKDLTADLPRWVQRSVLLSATTKTQWQQDICYRFLLYLTEGVQANVDRVLSLRNCVVEQMMADRCVCCVVFTIQNRYVCVG